MHASENHREECRNCSTSARQSKKSARVRRRSLANQRASRANLASAQASLSETRTRLAQSEIKAPVSGLIISRSVTKGQIVAAGTELFRMVREGRLELDAQVPETDPPALRAGQTATITSNEGVATSGTIRIVTPEVDAQTRLGLARITLSPGSGLKPGSRCAASNRAPSSVPNSHGELGMCG